MAAWVNRTGSRPALVNHVVNFSLLALWISGIILAAISPESALQGGKVGEGAVPDADPQQVMQAGVGNASPARQLAFADVHRDSAGLIEREFDGGFHGA